MSYKNIAIQGGIIMVALVLLISLLGTHTIDEGYVGVYWRFGALQERITSPGVHIKIPLIDSHEQVQVTLQTDSVTAIPCGTSGGVMVYFKQVEVVNRLHPDAVYQMVKNYTSNYDKTWIFDRVHHEMNQFCSHSSLQDIYIDKFGELDDLLALSLQRTCDQWAPGLEIISVRITKPTLPPQIVANYEQMEQEKNSLLIATQHAKVTEKHARSELEVSKIKMEQKVNERDTERSIQSINDQILLNQQRTLSDAAFYSETKKAEANSLLLTESYLKLQLGLAIANNTKIYFGPSVNSMYEMFDSLKTNKNLLGPMTSSLV
jgi:regulator of protease activity HflC (stomatin/prohibitin superfamily)